MIVAIHQPNYLPWLGYFRKIAEADAFVFLDDAQFTKNSYINRTRVLKDGGARWLTVPVKVSLGQPIDAVWPARADWRDAHLEALKAFYRDAPARRETLDLLSALYAEVPEGTLAAINRHLVEGLAGRLGFAPRFLAASDLGAADLRADERLIALCRMLDDRPTYLSGRGGAGYQDPARFAAAGVTLRYTDFDPSPYPQRSTAFVPGLSIVDALFSLGVEGTREAVGALVRGTRPGYISG